MAGAHDARTSGFALVVALVVHGLAAVAISRVGVAFSRPGEAPLVVEIYEVPPRPPDATPVPAPPRVLRRAEATPPPLATRVRPRNTPPPLPNQPPPPSAPSNTPPVFGVTMSSVVSGNAPLAVAVGHTTMTKPGTSPGTTSASGSHAGQGTVPFSPTPEVYIRTRARLLREINSDAYYPPDARALGIEGTVVLSVDIDQTGRVVSARVARPAGHGFDEKALEAMKDVQFSPALTGDDRPVPCRISFSYRFEVGK